MTEQTKNTMKEYLKQHEHSGNTTLPPVNSMKEHGATKEEIELAEKVHAEALKNRIQGR